MNYQEFLKHFPDHCVQLFDDSGKDRSMARTIAGSAANWNEIKNANEKGAGVFFSVNQFPEGIRKTSYCRGINAWFAESDERSKEEQQNALNSLKIAPSFVVESKKSLHAYWLAKDASMDNFRLIQEWLGRRLKGDPSMKDFARVLRVPEFYHIKDYNNPVLIKIISEHPENVYTEQQMLDYFVDFKQIKKDEEARAKRMAEIEAKIAIAGDDTYKAINNLPIEVIVAKEMGWRWDEKKHWYAPNSNAPSACFKANDGNYVVHGGTRHFPDTQEGYNPFSFIKMRYNLNDKEVFEWFRKEYVEIKNLDDKNLDVLKRDKLVNKTEVKRDNETKIGVRFKPYKAKELMTMETPPFPWLVEGIIPKNALTVIAGDTGCGKSLITLYLADRVSKGKDFLNKKKTEQTGVLIVDQEMTIDDQIDRVKKICHEDDDLYILCEKSFKVNEKENVADLIKFIQEKKIGLVVFDTFSKIHLGEENSNTEMTKVMDFLVDICRKYSVSIILLHHHNKSNEAVGYKKSRGASSIADNCASYLEVKSKAIKNEIGLDTLAMGFNQHKSRRRMSIASFGVNVINMPDETLTFEYVDKMVIENDKVDEAKNAVISFVSQNPGLAISRVSSAVVNKSITQRNVWDAIEILIANGILRESRGSRKSRLLSMNDDQIQGSIDTVKF